MTFTRITAAAPLKAPRRKFLHAELSSSIFSSGWVSGSGNGGALGFNLALINNIQKKKIEWYVLTLSKEINFQKMSDWRKTWD
jgi:hypothetical protein